MNRLQACRVCLAYDTRLCSIMDGQLRDVYETLVEASLDTEDMLPTSVCYICFSLMKKILQFRDRSQEANQILHQIISLGLQFSVSSLDMLVKNQTGISWSLGISDIDRTTTTSCEAEINVKLESLKTEINIDSMSDWNEDYSDDIPAHEDSVSNSEDDLPIKNMSIQCKTDHVKVEEPPMVHLQESSGYEGAALPEKQKLEKIESENESVNIQTPLIKNEKDEEPREKKNGKQELFKCYICEKGFSQRRQLTLHYRVHNQKKPFKCDICQKCFPFNSHLTRHYRVHTQEKPFKCDLCEKYFTQNCDLNRHLRVHTKEKPFKCDICNKCFSQNINLMAHLRVHTKEKPFKCDMCDMCFSENGHLTRHKRIHSGEKPYSCSYCNKRFSNKSVLNIHLRVHTKVKPFTCDVCKKCFSVSGTLRRHKQTHTGEKPYSCSYCDKRFADRQTSNAHQIVVHKTPPRMSTTIGPALPSSSGFPRP